MRKLRMLSIFPISMVLLALPRIALAQQFQRLGKLVLRQTVSITASNPHFGWRHAKTNQLVRLRCSLDRGVYSLEGAIIVGQKVYNRNVFMRVSAHQVANGHVRQGQEFEHFDAALGVICALGSPHWRRTRLGRQLVGLDVTISIYDRSSR